MGRDKPRSGKAVQVVKNLHIEYPGFAFIVGEKKNSTGMLQTLAGAPERKVCVEQSTSDLLSSV